MNMVNSQPQLQILLAAWRQYRNQSRPWVLPMILLLAAIPTVLMAIFQSATAAQVMAVVSMSLLLEGLWLVLFVGFRRQNHPNAARLVPGHLSQLRATVASSYVLLAIAIGGLMSLHFGHLLAWALAAAVLMLATAVMMRWPLLWSVFWIVPVSSGWWSRLPMWRVPSRLAIEAYQQQPMQLAVAALLILPALLCLLIQGGGSAHIKSYAVTERMRMSMQQASRGGSTLRYQGRVGMSFSWFFMMGYRNWLNHLLAVARPSARSAMARLELASAGGSHWSVQLGSALTILPLVALSLVASSLISGAPLATLLEHGKYGISIGLMSFAVNPILARQGGLYNSRREQGLLMLLPGMPRGAALNLMLARRHLIQFLLGWLIAFLLVLLLLGGDVHSPLLGYPVACLPGALLLLRDWSRMAPPSGSATGLGVMGLLLGGALMGGLMAWQGLSALTLLGLELLVCIPLGAWLLRRLGRQPQAFPVGRLA